MPKPIPLPNGTFGVKISVAGRQQWVGTFATLEAAETALETALRGRKRRKPAPRRVQPPTAEQVAALADEMPTAQLRAFTLCAAYSGLRLFEVAALEGRDVTVLDGFARLHVRNGKGGRARHSILLEPGLTAVRETVRPGLIFRTRCGNAWDRRTIHRVFAPARERVGLPHVVFHDLRRFYATLLLDRGVSDLDVAVALGHVDRLGRPNPELVRMIYGFPSHDDALARVAAAGSLTGSVG